MECNGKLVSVEFSFVSTISDVCPFLRSSKANLVFVVLPQSIHLKYSCCSTGDLKSTTSKGIFNTMYYCLLNGLDYLHNYNLRHADLKLENVVFQKGCPSFHLSIHLH
jgi:hypothetical protein